MRNLIVSEARRIERAASLLEKKEGPNDKLMDYANALAKYTNSKELGAHLWNVNVVIRRSPPSEELLGKLISSGTVGMGIYTGLSVVPEASDPYLLLAAVSGGIICISTAAGIGRALQDGLYQRILKVIASEQSKKRSVPLPQFRTKNVGRDGKKKKPSER